MHSPPADSVFEGVNAHQGRKTRREGSAVIKQCGKESRAAVTTSGGLGYLSGEGVVCTLRGQADHVFDFTVGIGIEVEMCPARKESIVVKGENKKMFLGYPTCQGTIYFHGCQSFFRYLSAELSSHPISE